MCNKPPTEPPGSNQTYKAAVALRARIKIGMTGTIVQVRDDLFVNSIGADTAVGGKEGKP